MNKASFVKIASLENLYVYGITVTNYTNKIEINSYSYVYAKFYKKLANPYCCRHFVIIDS